ncbi:hypothetical protein Syn7803US40_101 [Synechococcus phage ACG-2014f]|uniref:Uncharacterized protein n=1 Tax=Synechococcus phage ACG-2014f TaxID=1493511 RepID=A0A0E3FPV3_9CAUD|nr:hypothetical protein Syn7803US40_101 [Synechococcus phage ACG-2014f]
MFMMLTEDTLYSGCIYKYCFILSHVPVYLPYECYNRKEEITTYIQLNHLRKGYLIEGTNQYNNQWNTLREGNTNPLYNTPYNSII